VVILGHGTLALEDLNVHCRLVVLVSREDLGLLRGDHSVATNELGHHTTDGLDTKSERGHIQEEEVLATLAAKDARLLDHLLDLLFSEATLIIGDRDLLALACGLVLRSHIQDAVRVDLEGHLDLRLPTGRRGDPAKLKFAEQVVILGHGTLALEDLDVHCRLVVLVGREDLGLLCGDHRVATNELGHHATDGFDTKSERGHIQKEEVLATFAAEDARLHSGTVGDGFVRVDPTAGLFSTEEILDQLLNLRNPRRPANQYDLVNLGLL